MSTADPFSIDEPLPVGRTTLLEASAGTGKTYALAALATRFVAELDVPISKLLLVTFTRAATAELRERIRSRLAEAAAHLRQPSPTPDPLLRHLAAADDDARTLRQERLQRAVHEFDTATITTIHGFCAQVRAARGVLAGGQPDAAPVASEALLVEQVCADLVFDRASGAAGASALPSVKDLVTLVDKARTLGECTVRAESGRPEDELRAELVRLAVARVDERLADQGAVSYDSLLASARDAVREDPGLVQALRDQFRVALIDEFQDTDPVQWEIFRTLFHEPPGSTLVLVGDPKQAIYSFRGGDVYTYLEARADARVQALTTNQRSDHAVVQAMNALGRDHHFGDPRIAYQVVHAAERHTGRRLVLDDGSGPPRTAAGLAVRCLVDPSACGPGTKALSADVARLRIAADVADVAVGLVEAGRIEQPDGTPRPVRPADVAVLVSAASHAVPVADALRRRGLRVVLRLGDNVADSEAADQWRTLLHALDRPATTPRAAAAALTWFFGWSPEQVARAVDDDHGRDVGPGADRRPSDAVVDGGPGADEDAGVALVALQHRLARWSELLARRGIAALLGEIRRSGRLVPRLLADVDGERRLTDLEHLAELLHADGHRRGGTSAAAALAALDSLGGTDDDEVAAEAVQRRIESDSGAVQVLTVHGAKGLEFPVVLLPGLTEPAKRVQAGDGYYSFYDEATGGRVLDVTTKAPSPDGGKDIPRSVLAPHAEAEAKRQNCGDQHRMVYVALTRAVHHTVLWWCRQERSAAHLGGVARLLFGDDPSIAADAKVALPPPEDTVATLRQRFAGEPTVEVVEVGPEGGARTVTRSDDEVDPDGLQVAGLGRALARSASRWSFSSLTRTIRPAGSGDPTDEVGDDARAGDEGADGGDLPSGAPEGGVPDGGHPAGRTATEGTAGEASATGGPAGLPATSDTGGSWSAGTPWEGLGAGTGFGNLVHDLLEHADFTDLDLTGQLAAAVAGRAGVTAAQRERLPDALARALRTPLGTRFGNVRLCDVPASDRLDELAFHLPVSPRRPLRADRIGALAADLLEADDPARPWAEDLARGLSHVDLQGYLNGSVDLVLRHWDGQRVRYSVVDYKTNTLSARDRAANVADYHPDLLHRAMAHHQYPLQALLYSVALHRYLRWRLPGYDPAEHLGPVGYLFLRGMVGPDTPVADAGRTAGTPAGVHAWQVPARLVVALSDLLAGSGSEVAA